MTQAQIYNMLLAIQFASVVIMFVECAFIFIKWKTRLQGILFFNCVATLINSAGYLLEMTSKNQNEYIAALKMSYLGRSWVPFALLLFTTTLCNKPLKRYITIPLAFIHLTTFGLVFTFDRFDTRLYYYNVKFDESGLFPHITLERGIWYKFYMILLFFYIVYGIACLIVTAIKEKNKIFKKRLFTVTASIAVESLFYTIGFTKIAGHYDLTMIGYTLGAIIMCVALFLFDLLDTLELARDFVIEDISEGVVVFNQNGRIEYRNNSAIRIFEEKLSDDEIRGVLENAADKNETVTIDDKIYSIQRKQLLHKGFDRGVTYMLVDETDRIRYMTELKEQKEIAEEARKEAEAASASKSAFVSVVSHEIRTPMNAVVGMTDLMLRESESLSEKQKMYLNNIKNSGNALVMIVNDILDRSKIEAGKMEIVEAPYELRSMVSDVKLIIENRIGDKPVRLITDIDDRIPTSIVGDGLRVRQILINLLNNAVKFTDKGSINLYIRCVDREEDKLILRFGVKDTGQGIKPEDLKRLGQAFAQVDTKKNHGKEGTGLGLSISKDFISLMGGQLEVISEYGNGSEFFFTIKQGIDSESDVLAEDKPETGEKDFVCPAAKILVVDDTDINLMLIEELLKPLELTTDTVTSGAEAIKLIAENHYDLIFMDYMMPEMDGVETTEKIRELAAAAIQSAEEEKAAYYKSVPIIALTADDSDATKNKFSAAGINDFTAKPVDITRLKNVLLKWLPENLIVTK